MKNKRKIIIIGAGISGCVLAERYANKLNKEVLIIEKRDHVGGNCYDYINDIGMLVPKYGPHFFHTNYQDVWDYISRFTELYKYEHRVLSFVDSKLVPVPVNIKTINDIFGLNIQTESQMIEWLSMNTEKIKKPKNSEESSLARVGKVLYEKMFKNYTKKQWDMWPSELDPLVMNRIPVRVNFDDRYFTDRYQAMPRNGYTKLFERMLNNKNIKIRLNTDYLDVKNEFENYEKIFFCGKIDQFFEYKFTKLEYRSVIFEAENLKTDYYQKATTINYPNDYNYTRITEPKHSNYESYRGVGGETTIIKEYPTWEGEPYYPVPNLKNQELYKKYQDEAMRLEKNNIFFVGRLANYKYFNMDQAFKNALDLFNNLENI